MKLKTTEDQRRPRSPLHFSFPQWGEIPDTQISENSERFFIQDSTFNLFTHIVRLILPSVITKKVWAPKIFHLPMKTPI